MLQRFYQSLPIILFLFVTSLFFAPGCANIVPPSGGTKDTIPPRLIKAVPKDSALNINGSKITLQFDEFVELQNAAEQTIISPLPQKQPQIESKLKTVTVRFKDSLKPNTTYTIDFGNALADINEGNIQKNFRYIFSTGNYIDSLSLSGRIILAENGKTDSTLWALLYNKEEDSTVFKESPSYITRVNSKGFFQFENLPAGTYYVYGLGDADGNKRYNQSIETFAFSDRSVTIPGDSLIQTLYAFAAEKDKKRDISASGNNITSADKFIYQTNVKNGALDLMDTLTINFKLPLAAFNKKGVTLYEDSTLITNNPEINLDSQQRNLMLITTLRAGGRYKLILPKEFARDSSGRSLSQNDTIAFRVKEEKEYGSLRLRFSQLDLSKKPVLLFYQNGAIQYSFPLRDAEFYMKLFKPGTYSLAILYDTNGNGSWDPGDYFSKNRKQPEIVIAINKEVIVKENWDNETEIGLLGNTP